MHQIFAPSVVYDQRTHYHLDAQVLAEVERRSAEKKSAKSHKLRSFKPKSGRPRKDAE